VTTAQISLDAPGEQWRRPSPKLSSLRHVEVAAAGVVLLLAVALPLLLAVGATAGVIAALAVLAVAAVSDVLLQRRVRAWSFAEREDDLLVRRGLLFRRLSLVPYGRMQFIDVKAGPFERSIGLATVHLHTAAAATDARIPGLARADAERLRDQLSALGNARAAGL
jgi:membrane protein YdbS with pleckstrin-like domain